MAQEPDLIISAGFSDAQLVRETDRIVALYRKKGQDAQKAFQDAQGRVTNTAAARAHARELDRLSKSYDPVYRAAKQYEAEVKRLDRALDLGVVTQQQYTAQVERAAREMQQATGATKQVAAANTTLVSSFRSTTAAGRALDAGADSAGRGMGNLRNQVQNTAFQFQDFIVQVQGGTAATTAAAQQLPQLLGGFGALGAVLGLVAAIAIPVGAALFQIGRDSEDAAEKSKAFDDALGKVRSSMGEFADAIDTRAVGSVDDMIERFGRADEAVKQLMDRMREAAKEDAFEGFGLSIDEAVKGLDSAQDRIAQIFGRLTALRDEQSAAQARLAELQQNGPRINDRPVFGAQEVTALLDIQDAQREFARLNAEVANFGISPAQISTFNDAWRALDGMLDEGNFTGAADQLATIQDILRATGNQELVDVANLLDQVGEELREGAAEAGEVARRAEDISLAAQGITFDGAVQGAQTLADVLAEAARNMASLESSQAQQLARARIRQQYFGDEVGEAGAMARLEFQDTLPAGASLTPAQQADRQAREDAYVSEAQEIARLEQQRLAAERAAAEAERASRKGAGDAARDAKKQRKAFLGMFDGDEITALERQIELIGKSTTEVAKLQAQWAIMDEAKRAGIPLTADMNTKIAAQADEVARLTGELERGELAQKQFDTAMDNIAGSLSNLITSGESVRESLANIFRSIANDIVKSGISSALAGVFKSPATGGGGGLGGFLSNIFGGFRASGGPVQPGKAYVVGEKGPELIVPGSVGTVIPNHKLDGGAGSASITIDVTGATGNSEVQRMVAAGVTQGLAEYDRAMPQRLQQINQNPRFR